ncbi:MAG: outer membrane beta-barrel protein [Saonia sp.]
MSKKKIDELFQEKLKSFDEIPDEKVWKAIETSLDQRKKSRKLIPLWWKLGGVAALLAIVLYVINPFASGPDIETIITDVDDTKTQKIEQNKSPDNRDHTVPDENLEKVVTTPENNAQINADDHVTPLEKKSSYPETTEESLANSQIKKEQTHDIDQNIGNQKNRISSAGSQNKSTNDNKDIAKTNKEDSFIDSKKEAIAKNLEEDQINHQKNQNPKENKEKGIFKKEMGKEAVVQTDKQKQTDAIEESNKKSIFDEIAAQEEEALIAENNTGKWSVGPSVAPVYFDSFGEGSPIHSDFTPNSKSGNVNFSYGLSVSYEINKRLSLRTGIHKVDYGYDTDQVEFSSSIDGSTNAVIDNIDYSRASRNLVIRSKASGGFSDPLSNSVEFVSAETPSLDGRMVQEFGYLEVPFELNYALVDKKMGVNVIGGFSSLFLVDDAIRLESEGLSTEVGTSNKINSVNFSTNVGLGINYKFSSKVRLNVEPIFKYQLNTFSETAGDFRPFSIGVYSGINYRF